MTILRVFNERRDNRFHICSFQDQFFHNAKLIPDRCSSKCEHPHGSPVRKLFDVFNSYPCSTPHAEAYLSGPKFLRTSIYCPNNKEQSANEGVSQGNKPCHFKVSHCVICHGDLLPPQCIYDEQARYLHKNEILHSEKELARDERTRMRVHASITYRSITNIVCKHNTLNH